MTGSSPSQPSLMNRLALVDRVAGVALRRFIPPLFCVPSGEGNFFDSRLRLSSNL